MIQTLPVKIEWQEIDADGSKCPFCGEAIYLAAYLMAVYTKSGQLLRQIPRQICQSCKECIYEEYYCE